MLDDIVSLDLETTGFDPARDEIIEIGAVRVRDGVSGETFQTYVNPGRPIPPVVTQLTGIRDEDVADAPSPADALRLLNAFVGQRPFVGHNVGFDAGFINQRGGLMNNARIDTFELAAILLPEMPRYNLGSLAEHYGYDLVDAHRALDDARATAHVFLGLWRRLLELPPEVALEVLDIGRDIAWDGRLVFEESLRIRGALGQPLVRTPAFSEPARQTTALRAVEEPGTLNEAEVLGLLTDDGALAQRLSRFEQRPQQQEMALRVARALNEGGTVFVEAGTGTGKSLAYLLPAALWAVRTGRRVVVSTHTINLQEQLLLKDIPDLAGALDTPFRAALLKGRSNYLCPRRFELARYRPAASADELRLMGKLIVWTARDKSGDRGSLSFRGAEGVYWSRVSAEDRGCSDHMCQYRMEGVCPLFKARRAAEAAHIVVVNHALLVADGLADNQLLPQHEQVIVDEAHQFEDAVTSGMSVDLDEQALRRRLTDLGSAAPARGILGGLMQLLRRDASETDYERFKSRAADIGPAVQTLITQAGQLFKAVQQVARVLAPSGDYMPTVRFTSPVRDHDVFSKAADAAGTMIDYTMVVVEALLEFHRAVSRLTLADADALEDQLSALQTEARALGDIAAWLNECFVKPDDNQVYWVTASLSSEAVALHSAPLVVSELVRDGLTNRNESVVFTSATLQARGDFEYVKQRLGCDDADTLDVGTPFDYRSSTLLYLPDDLPEPNDRHRYQAAVESAILELAMALEGRTMVLFTSYNQLKQTAAAVGPRLSLGGIRLYDQGEGISRQMLLDGFKRAERAVLFGTRSFWEGVDVPGDGLSGLVIARLPFAVPTDPIVAARTERYADPFREYSVPDAILRFRQGFGRLIRSKTDRGVVTVLDSRIVTKAYGREFIDALPDCTLRRGSVSELGSAAKRWLALTAP